MATMYFSQNVNVSADAGWKVLEDYTRAESHLFTAAASARMENVTDSTERPEGEYRVVTVAGDEGVEMWELLISTDKEHRRASYTVPGVFGANHHNAYMQILPVDENTSELIWVTDVLPDSYADSFAEFYAVNFADMVNAVEGKDLSA